MNSFFKLKWALPTVALLGIGLAVAIVKLQPDVVHNPLAAKAVAVNVITVEEQQVRPIVVGFGNVSPDRSLEAKAEVSGRVTYVHPELKKGAILSKDTLVISIDDKDYQLALKQAQADLLSHQASLQEMQQTERNVELELKLANEKLAVRQRELERLERLQSSGSISQSKLDAERQNFLQQQQEVQRLENQINTLPSNIEVIRAKIAISEAKLAQSERNIERTQIRIPFTGRISQVWVEADHYVTTATPLFSAFSMEKMLVTAQFPVDQFGQLAASFDQNKLLSLADDDGPAMDELFKQLGLSAVVSVADSPFQGWHADVERLSDNLDPQSRTIGAVVSVSNSYTQMIPGQRPPLMEGMYMRVVLKAAPKQALVIPRFALHQQQVFKVSAENRLERLSLDDIQLQGELALIHAGLTPGDRIITSDVFPAIDGMLVEPKADETTRTRLIDWVEQTL